MCQCPEAEFVPSACFIERVSERLREREEMVDEKREEWEIKWKEDWEGVLTIGG